MGTGAIIKAAQTKALVSGVADLFAKRAERRSAKQGAALVVTKLTKAAAAGKMTKQALLSALGQILLRFGGKGLRWGGKGLQRLGLAGAGQKLRRTGAKMRGTASKATLLERAQKGQQAAAGQTGRAGRKAQRAATQKVKALGPEAEKSLNISKGVGAGGLGLGAYGLASMLSGGGDEY